MYHTGNCSNFRRRKPAIITSGSIMKTNLYTTKTPPDALRTIAQIRVLTARGWHLPSGNIMLLCFEWLFYIIAAVWLAAAVFFNEEILLDMLGNRPGCAFTGDTSLAATVAVQQVIKVLMAILGLFSLAVGLLLRKWHRKNKMLMRIHRLTEQYVPSAANSSAQ